MDCCLNVLLWRCIVVLVCCCPGTLLSGCFCPGVLLSKCVVVQVYYCTGVLLSKCLLSWWAVVEVRYSCVFVSRFCCFCLLLSVVVQVCCCPRLLLLTYVVLVSCPCVLQLRSGVALLSRCLGVLLSGSTAARYFLVYSVAMQVWSSQLCSCPDQLRPFVLLSRFVVVLVRCRPVCFVVVLLCCCPVRICRYLLLSRSVTFEIYYKADLLLSKSVVV